MKPLFASIWQRRWCRAGLVVAVLLGLACLHPSLRQRVFGPMIDGVPWCEWENEIRAQADPQREIPWLGQMLAKVGLFDPDAGGRNLDDYEFLPVILELADDRDVMVRRFCLERLAGRRDPGHAEIAPVLQRHLQDADPRCRVHAVGGLWRATGDPKLLAELVAALDHPDSWVRFHAIQALCKNAKRRPDLFELMAKLCEHPDDYTRGQAMSTMHHFGKKGLPIIQKGLTDPDARVRDWAVLQTFHYEADAAELMPALRALRTDPDSAVRNHTKQAVDYLERPPIAVAMPPFAVPVGPGN